MLRRGKVGVALLALVVGAAACGGGSHSLDGSSWDSTSIVGHELVGDTRLSFTFDDGHLAWNAGCNTTTTDYAVDEADRLALEGVATTTSKSCGDVGNDQDRWFGSLLSSDPEIEVEGNTLTLASGDTTIEFARR